MNLQTLSHFLSKLVIFKNLRNDPVIQALTALLAADKQSATGCALDLAAVLYPQQQNLTEYVKQQIACDDNYYIRAAAKGLMADKTAAAWLDYELGILSKAASYSSQKLIKHFGMEQKIPVWQAQEEDFSAFYSGILASSPANGYGIFAQYRAFRLSSGGELIPVSHPDPQTMDSLYGYETERQTVYHNTKALLSGAPCNNILLYGDAGTGKSSTVKAVANDLAASGLRLIQVDKSYLHALPSLLEALGEIPLKFIVFIDDLTFAMDNSDFTQMKTILEGGVSARASNTVVYATSNRRHLVRESFSDRNGDDMHIADTIEEVSSLSARFGILVLFGKPGRDAYFDLVRALADEHGLSPDDAALTAEAERFASYAGGRSPRVAKQYIMQKIAGKAL